ncbi:MAG: DNA methyltransferase [Ekhidna sp.]|nr:DNA methyltransferase [Ekhidna sp.]
MSNSVGEIAAAYRTNKVKEEDGAIHNWYRFVLSFPPHLVKYYLEKFDVSESERILDPFCGTGTTLIESKINLRNSIGIEANPIVRYATKTKLNWNINTDELINVALDIAQKVNKRLLNEGIDDRSLVSNNATFLRKLPEESEKILIKNSISPVPLHKSLVLLEEIRNSRSEATQDHLILAFLKTTVKYASNLRFGPEIGVGKIKKDAFIIDPWLDQIRTIAEDINDLQNDYQDLNAEIIFGDSRNSNQYLSRSSVNVVITSPPYPNEKDYSRTTRLENVLLGSVKNLHELRSVKKNFVRSNTRSVYKEDNDHEYIKDISIVHQIAKQIEDRRTELNKTSGFEKMYSKVILQYFGGMARHLSNLRNSLAHGAKLAYIVGDQASYLRVMIRTGSILAEIAESLGYKVADIELFRTRFATATKEDLREEVLILEWTGANGK